MTAAGAPAAAVAVTVRRADPPAGGDGPAPPVVVFVHGSMDRGAGFANTARRLRDVTVVRYDRRGYGRSVHLPPAGLEGHVADLLGVLDGRPAVVVGHSYGGVVACTAAARCPDLVRAVGAFEAPMPWLGWWPVDPSREVDPDDPEATAAAAERFLRRMIGDQRWEALPAAIREGRRAEGRALVADGRELRAAAPFDPGALAVPVVAGRGTRSGPALRRAAAELAEAAPLGELVELQGADHGPHLSMPDAFAGYVRRVLARAGGPSSAPAA